MSLSKPAKAASPRSKVATLRTDLETARSVKQARESGEQTPPAPGKNDPLARTGRAFFPTATVLRLALSPNGPHPGGRAGEGEDQRECLRCNERWSS